MRVAVPDLISNSYFPVVASVVLGACREEGLNCTIELISPLNDCVKALLDGKVDFVGVSAHAPLLAFPSWRGVRLLCAQSQGLYWLLVMRKELGIGRGDLAALKGKRIAAVPFVGAALRRILIAAGLSLESAGIEIVVPDAARRPGVNFGLAATDALREGTIDGFFANGVGAERAIFEQIGTLVLDIRRGDEPRVAFGYTMPAVAATEQLIETQPSYAAAMIRAVVKTQKWLKVDPKLATEVGRVLFPALEADLIAHVVKRDLPFYNAALPEPAIAKMNQFARDVGLLQGSLSYDKVVASRFRTLWDAH